MTLRLRSGQAALDFELPKQLEAREPAELRGMGREDVRMLVSDRATGAVTHAQFCDLPWFLRRGDLLVLNTSATLPAALTAIRENGDVIALHWSTPLPGGLAVLEPRVGASPSGVHGGESFTLPGGGRAMLLAPYRDSKRLWVAQLEIDLARCQALRVEDGAVAVDLRDARDRVVGLDEPARVVGDHALAR